MVNVAQDRIIDLAEAARMLGVTTATIRNWTKRTDGPQLYSFKVGRLVRTTTQAVQQFIEEEQADHLAQAQHADTVVARYSPSPTHEESVRRLRARGLNF